MNPPLKESDFTSEELEKCKNSPVYFYNKYIRKEGMREFTEDEYFSIVKDAELIRNRLPPSWKFRNRGKDYPLKMNECFPDFLKERGQKNNKTAKQNVKSKD